jgi:biopolymer transport protein ExbD
MDVGGAKGGYNSTINVTPLVDVMLVLLIIMMVVAPMLQKGVNVKLPEAANTAEKPDTNGQAVVAIGKDQPDKVVLIKADEAVDYAVVMDTMDQLRQGGIEVMALITERKMVPGGAN